MIKCEGWPDVAPTGAKSDLPSPPGTLVSYIADIVWVDALRMAKLAVIAIAGESALMRIGGLRTRLVLLAPTELRLQW